MSVIVKVRPQPKPKRGPRGQHYDEAIRRLAPAFGEARETGRWSVDDIMQYLNEQGVKPPTGKYFSSGTTFRALTRLEELGLGPGPRTVSAAASERHRSRMVRLRREHPEWQLPDNI